MCFIFVLILFGYLNLHMYKNDLPNSDTDKFTEINQMAHKIKTRRSHKTFTIYTLVSI